MLVAVLVLSSCAFVFAGEKVWAQQQHVEVIEHAVINGEDAAEPAIGTLPAKGVSAETPPASTPSLDLPPADRPEPGYEARARAAGLRAV